MWQKFSDEQSALIIHSHPPSQFTPLLSKNKKENITKFRQKYSFHSVLLKARQILKLALSENIKLHTPVPKETTQHGWPIYYPWHTSGDQTGVKSSSALFWNRNPRHSWELLYGWRKRVWMSVQRLRCLWIGTQATPEREFHICAQLAIKNYSCDCLAKIVNNSQIATQAREFYTCVQIVIMNGTMIKFFALVNSALVKNSSRNFAKIVNFGQILNISQIEICLRL